TQHAIDCTRPAGMGRTDNGRFRVDEEERGAVGGQNAEEDVAAGGDEGVGLDRAVGQGAVADGDDAGRMDVLERHQWAAAETFSDDRPVLFHLVRLIPGGDGNVEAVVFPGRYAAF